MWIYIQSEKNPPLYTVGHYDPDGFFVPESDWSESEDAARRVSFLNGNKNSERSAEEESMR